MLVIVSDSLFFPFLQSFSISRLLYDNIMTTNKRINEPDGLSVTGQGPMSWSYITSVCDQSILANMMKFKD